jgi:hypothetical protein
VIPHDENIKEQMLPQEIGIGQLLTERRKAGKEDPFFRLIAAGRKEDGILTRQYILDIPGEITFLIHEELHLDVIFGKLGIMTSQQDEISWGAGLNLVKKGGKTKRKRGEREKEREKENKFAPLPFTEKRVVAIYCLVLSTFLVRYIRQLFSLFFKFKCCDLHLLSFISRSS